MKTIQKELGEDSQTVELDELKKKIEDVKMSDEASQVANKELDRLGRISPQSPEYSVARTYLEWLTELPWSKSSKDNLNVKEAQKRLDQDHYGLPKVKERVLEYLAVRSLKKKVTKTEKASLVGTLIAERAVSAGIKKCAFDRNGYLYHGRVKSLADGIREKGIEF